MALYCIYYSKRGKYGSCKAGEPIGLDCGISKNTCAEDYRQCPRFLDEQRREKRSSVSNDGANPTLLRVIVALLPILFWLDIFSIILYYDEGIATSIVFSVGGSIVSTILSILSFVFSNQ